MEPIIYEFSSWVKYYDGLVNDLEDSLLNSKHTVLGQVDYVFMPQGYTKLWLLGESHFAIHTYPEHNTAYVQLSSCNQKMFNKLVKALVNNYKLTDCRQNITRAK